MSSEASLDPARLFINVSMDASFSSSPIERDATTVKAHQLPSLQRVLIVGDSITHGAEGDHTWRYRIWQWFKANKVAIDFVGPWDGTYNPDPPLPPQPPTVPSDPVLEDPPRTTGGYARDVDPKFDSQHFSSWGRALALTTDKIEVRVRRSQPDLILVLLGFNDLAWLGASSEELLDSMKAFIDNARKANPSLRFAVGNVVQRTDISNQGLVDRTITYNRDLPRRISQWTRPSSPVYHVDVEKYYDCGPQYKGDCPASYDGVHPNALGEYQIAKAFSETLYGDFKLGSGSLKVPHDIPTRDLTTPSNVRAVGAPMGVKLTWKAIYGGSYEVQSRPKGGTWSSNSVNAPRYDTVWSGGQEFEYQVRTVYGSNTGAWSEIVSAISRRDTAPPPRDIVVTPKAGGFDISWSPPNGNWDIDRYQIIWHDTQCPGGCFPGSVGTRGSSAQVRDLVSGHKYNVWMATWINNPDGGGGEWGDAPSVTPS